MAMIIDRCIDTFEIDGKNIDVYELFDPEDDSVEGYDLWWDPGKGNGDAVHSNLGDMLDERPDREAVIEYLADNPLD